MYCTKCGQPINENHKYCPNCGSKIEETSKKSIAVEDEKQANILCLLSIILTLGSYFLNNRLPRILPNNLSSSLATFGPLAGLVLIIVARVKYPKSVFAKVLMWIYILLIIFFIIAYIVFVVSCFYACTHMDTSSCG